MRREAEGVLNAASQRERQQGAVADLGQLALEGCSAENLFARAVGELAAGLGLRFVKLLELSPDGGYLTMRAGVGWADGLVGQATVPADERSQAGYTLRREETIVVRDFRREERFAPPKLLTDHGILCGASIIVGPVHEPWGVLGVHEREPGRCNFNEHDLNFVRSVANIIWLHLRNERARREAEQERNALRSFADAMPILFSIVDAQGRYEFVNMAYRSFDLDPRSLVGRHVSEVFDPEAVARAKPHVAQALGGNVVSFENRLRLAGGDEIDVLTTFAPRFAADGQQSGFYAAAVDISAQKRRQREIIERTQQYRAIADSIPYGVWTCDATGRLTYVSEAFLDLVDMTFEEAADFGWISRLIPGTAEEMSRAWEDCVRRRGNWEREHRFIGSDGRHYDILSIARPVLDPGGDLLSYVGLNLDITDRKRREETLALVSAELDHRVKNVFALVTTIARQASRRATSVEAFQQSFEGRMRALSLAHELIAEGGWEGMSLESLFRAELEPYRDQTEAEWRLDGPHVSVPVEAVQPLVLAVHELATNAVKYGALEGARGRLDVTWARQRGGDLAIEWRESGLSGVTPPASHGFGSRVLTQVLEMQLGAEVDLDFQEDGLKVRIVLPAARLLMERPQTGA
jgi:PAS domain S-box-containing protein